MIANIQCAGSRDQKQGLGTGSDRLLSSGQASRLFNIHPNTLRRYTDSGRLPVLVLPSGHRRIREADLLSFLGAGETNSIEGPTAESIRVAAVIRVSSRGQACKVGNADKSSLEHQRERIQKYIEERWGAAAHVTEYASIGSGLNFERVEFLQLVQDVLNGDYRGGFIVASDFSRICRFGIKLFEHICKLGGCSIVYTMDERQAKTSNETLVDDVLGVLTHFTAKASGEKAKKALKINLDQESLQAAYRLYKEGYSYRHIHKEFLSQGRRDAKGRPYSRSIVRQCLLENFEALEVMFGDDSPKSSFQEFVAAKVRRVSDGSCVTRKRLIDAYREWCKEHGVDAMSERKISAHFPNDWKRKFDGAGCVVFIGLSLLA